jgi:hypothetical protein
MMGHLAKITNQHATLCCKFLKRSKSSANISRAGLGLPQPILGVNQMTKTRAYRVETPLETLHAQLEYSVQFFGGKTTITQNDLDIIQEAICAINNNQAIDRARTNNVLGETEHTPDTWQSIGGVVGKIVDKAKHNRDVRLMAEWAGYEDDDIEDYFL